ncbi:hypothetical protein BJF85_00885 [Saccharomonospora sp. CUA-673]|uniref:hypothetical protein n=1 Tax=Saccharomonospora sp. CUA-673 TaxID=1904969 RepID=UPI00096170BB|nr:hypothetical protein [Saccharomonospora sp. CUA-673]OLT47020.1 hypothetical protein BJF85_00885 [Saccharomonospora sp. CUA-673]
MTDDTRPSGSPTPEPEEGDPTAEFLDQVRPEETPWRVDRTPDTAPDGNGAEQYEPQSYFNRATDAVGRAAPMMALGGVAGIAGADAYHRFNRADHTQDAADGDHGDPDDLGDLDMGGGI